MLQDDPDFLTAGSTADYLTWLRAHRRDWLRRGRIPPIVSTRLDEWTLAVSDYLAEWVKRTPGLWRLKPWFEFEYGPTRLRRYLFPWAVERATERYSTNRLGGRR